MLKFCGQQSISFSFNMLGHLMSSLGTYRVLFKDIKLLESGELENLPKLNSKYLAERIEGEKNLQLSLWQCLKLNHAIDFEKLLALLILLFSAKNYSKKPIVSLLKSRIFLLKN